MGVEVVVAVNDLQRRTRPLGAVFVEIARNRRRTSNITSHHDVWDVWGVSWSSYSLRKVLVGGRKVENGSSTMCAAVRSEPEPRRVASDTCGTLGSPMLVWWAVLWDVWGRCGTLSMVVSTTKSDG